MRIGFHALVVFSLAAFGPLSCTQIEARDLIREGNNLYADGQYVKAIEKYDQAHELEPDGVTLLWNRACAAESIVLPLKTTENESKLTKRKKYADIALSDFETWNKKSQTTEAHTPEDDKAYTDHRLAILNADSRCEDLVSYYGDKLKAKPKEEELYGVIARLYEEICSKPEMATEWYKKRAEAFPKSAKAWHILADRYWQKINPQTCDEPCMFVPDYSPEERRKVADQVIAFENKATEADPTYQDSYIWRSMAWTQRRFSWVHSEPPLGPHDELNALRARRENMSAWKERRARCDVAKMPDCAVPGDVPSIVASPADYKEGRVHISAKAVSASVKGAPSPTGFTIEMELEGGLKMKFTLPAKSEGIERSPEEMAIFGAEQVEAYKADPDENGLASQKGTFEGKTDANGVFIATLPVYTCCDPTPMSPADLAKDSALEPKLEADIAKIEAREARRAQRRGR